MSVLVTDAGFSPNDRPTGFSARETLLADQSTCNVAMDLAADTPIEELAGLVPGFDRIALVRIPFAQHMDGRGFTLARQLRLLGYKGRLRASGHVIADQYAMARRSGFDEVEINAELAARQPEEQWAARSCWRSSHYQGRLGMDLAGVREGPVRDE